MNILETSTLQVIFETNPPRLSKVFVMYSVFSARPRTPHVGLADE